MTPTTTELLELLQDRLRHAAQYAEAARETIAEALALLEAAEKEEDDRA